VELHPIWRQEKLREYCKQKSIVITAYSPLGAPNNVYGTNDVITNSTTNEIAQRIHKTPAQVCTPQTSPCGLLFFSSVFMYRMVSWHLIPR
jgi:diketogulonate reductase-like aldo/keto reductase